MIFRVQVIKDEKVLMEKEFNNVYDAKQCGMSYFYSYSELYGIYAWCTADWTFRDMKKELRDEKQEALASDKNLKFYKNFFTVGWSCQVKVERIK